MNLQKLADEILDIAVDISKTKDIEDKKEVWYCRCCGGTSWKKWHSCRACGSSVPLKKWE